VGGSRSTQREPTHTRVVHANSSRELNLEPSRCEATVLTTTPPCSPHLYFVFSLLFVLPFLHLLPQFPPTWPSAPLLSPVLHLYPQLHSVTDYPPQSLVPRFVLSICQILTVTSHVYSVCSSSCSSCPVRSVYSSVFVCCFGSPMGFFSSFLNKSSFTISLHPLSSDPLQTVTL